MITQAKPQPHVRTGLIWAVGLSLGMGAATLLIVLGVGSFRLEGHNLGGGFSLASLLLGVWLILLTLFWARRQGRLDIFELPIWFSGNAYAQLILNLWLFQPDFKPSSPWLKSQSIRPDQLQQVAVDAVALLGFALTVLWISYMITVEVIGSRRRRLEREGKAAHRYTMFDNPREKPRMVAIAAAWLLSTAAYIFSIVIGSTSYVKTGDLFILNYVAFTSLIGDMAMFLLLIYHFRRPTLIGWLWVLALIGLEIGSGLLVGTKTAIFIFLYVAVAYYFARDRLPVRWAVVGALALVLSVPIANVYRSNLQRANLSGESLGIRNRINILFTSVNTVFSRQISSLAEETQLTFERRQGAALEFAMAVIVAHPERVPFLFTEMITSIAQDVVPRALWPDKPLERAEVYNISKNYFGWAEEISFSEAPAFADSYRAGGLPFTFVWFVLIGLLFGVLMQYVRQSMSMTALYLTLIASVVLYSSSLGEIGYKMIQFVPLLFIVVRFVLFRPGQRKVKLSKLAEMTQQRKIGEPANP